MNSTLSSLTAIQENDRLVLVKNCHRSPARGDAIKHVTNIPSIAYLGQPVPLPGRNRGGLRNIVRLPFRKIIKLNTTRNEVDAIEYVRTNTSIPIPKVYEVYERLDGAVHIVMEALPGDGTDYANMSPEQVQAFGDELSGYLHQLRSLEPPEEGFIGSVNRESLLDHRAGHSLRAFP